jgi:hypothetical protein
MLCCYFELSVRVQMQPRASLLKKYLEVDLEWELNMHNEYTLFLNIKGGNVFLFVQSLVLAWFIVPD